MRNQQIELGQGQARTEQIGCASWRKGVGGLNPWPRPSCYHPCPHAQIFFRRGIPLIIFFKSKKSNGGALRRKPQRESFQALTRSVLGARRRARWKSGIYFRSPSRWTRRGVRASVDPGTRTAGLIPSQNLGIKYRKPTRHAGRPQGGLNLWRLSAGDRVAGPRSFPRNSENFFYSSPQAPAAQARLKNRREIQGGGG
jgi:hypothetical protein